MNRALIAMASCSLVFAQSLLDPKSLKTRAPNSFQVRFTTTKGDFVVDVHRDWAPIGADRFYNLVTNGFYDDASFFRVIRGFVVQFGMHAKPEIQRAWQSANIRDDAVKQSNKRGYLVFASAGPNTRTTQVFINLGNNAQLDAQGFSPFGNIVEGMDVVEKFYSGYGDPPRGPDQGRITAQGRAYLDKNFPNLDRIISATLAVQDEAPTAAKLGTVYISNQSSADKLQLNADGTFSLQEGGQSFSGTYLVRGRTLKLHIDQLKKEVNIEIQEDSLIVNGNEIWVQPKQ